MYPPVGGPWDTARATLAQTLMQAAPLHALGLAESGSVLQADTVNSPATKPFIVIRWGDVERIVGKSWLQPVDLWIYDDFGDYDRATRMAKTAGKYLHDNVLGLRTNTGWISQIDDRGIGGDLADDGFDALVIPYRLAAIGTGD